MLRTVLRMLGGEGFGARNLSIWILLRAFLVQKVLRINGSATWPVHWTSTVKAASKVRRGTRFPGLSAGCHIDGRNGIHIAENVWIGPRVSLISMNHDTSNFFVYCSAPPITIGRNSWIGANSTILPGVSLGEHTVVAAGSVVTKSFPGSNQLLGGVPARVLKSLPEYAGPC